MINQSTIRNSIKYFRIVPDGKYYNFQQTSSYSMYNENITGLVRKAIVGQSMIKNYQGMNSVYSSSRQNSNLSTKITNSQYQYQKLSHIYPNQVDIFQQGQNQPSFVMPSTKYYSFLGESGMIDLEYLKTLIITRKINQAGIYTYFVKRSGQYYLQQCDDYIPVNVKTGQPIPGLSWKRPLQIILFKIWLNQCGSIENVLNAHNFKFLQAFGLPQYRTFNFRKQLEFFRNYQIQQNKKKQYLKQYTLNRKSLVIISQTIDSQQIIKYGLVPNAVGYRIQKVGQFQQESIYRVFSCLPYQWKGKYSKSKNSAIYNMPNFSYDYTKSFLLTQQQVLKYFKRSYVAPLQLTQPLRTQDCLNLQTNGQGIWIRFQVKNSGLLSLSLQLPQIRIENKYPQIKYFIVRNLTLVTSSLSTLQLGRSSYRTVQLNQTFQTNNTCISSCCDKWSCFRIDYVQGYHNSASSFSKITPGLYILYIQIEHSYKDKLNLRIDSQLDIRNPEQFFPDTQLKKQIFDSCFYSISEQQGIQTSLNNNNMNQTITINDNFQKYGFGSICLKTSQQSVNKIAMRVYHQRLMNYGYQLLQHYKQLQINVDLANFVLISDKGRSQIIVLQKLKNYEKYEKSQVFPPPGCIQFFVVKPEIVRNSY